MVWMVLVSSFGSSFESSKSYSGSLQGWGLFPHHCCMITSTWLAICLNQWGRDGSGRRRAACPFPSWLEVPLSSRSCVKGRISGLGDSGNVLSMSVGWRSLVVMSWSCTILFMSVDWRSSVVVSQPWTCLLLLAVWVLCDWVCNHFFVAGCSWGSESRLCMQI